MKIRCTSDKLPQVHSCSKLSTASPELHSSYHCTQMVYSYMCKTCSCCSISNQLTMAVKRGGNAAENWRDFHGLCLCDETTMHLNGTTCSLPLSHQMLMCVVWHERAHHWTYSLSGGKNGKNICTWTCQDITVCSAVLLHTFPARWSTHTLAIRFQTKTFSISELERMVS